MIPTNHLLTVVIIALILISAEGFVLKGKTNVVALHPFQKSLITCFLSDFDDDDWYADYNPDDFIQSNTQNSGNDYNTDSSSYGGRRGGRGGRHHGYERDTSADNSNVDIEAVNSLIQKRADARRAGEFDLADAIRDQLMAEYGVRVWDRERVWRSGCSLSGSGSRRPSGRFGDRQREPKDFGPLGHDYFPSPDAGPIQASLSEDEINRLLAERLRCKLSRNFRKADRIQEELSQGGVYINDGKKEWRADGIMFGDYLSANKPRRERGSRSDRNRPYTQSEHSLSDDLNPDQVDEVQALISRRAGAKLSRDYLTADSIRENLKADYNVFIDDRLREWSVGGNFGADSRGSQDINRPWAMSQHSEPVDEKEEALIMDALDRRTEARGVRDFSTADAIRESLLTDYNVAVNDRLREWSVGGNFGLPAKEDRNRPFIRRGGGDLSEDDVATIAEMVEKRSQAKRDRDFETADTILNELQETYSVKIDDRSREWRVLSDEYVLSPTSGGRVGLNDETMDYIQSKLRERSRFKTERDYDSADAIRDELRDNYAVSIDDRVREWSVKEYSSSPREAPSLKHAERSASTEDASPTIESNESETVEAAVSSIDIADEENLSELTVVQLKERLKKAGLAVSGRKAELIERLTAAT